jgi:hypothetical protein
MTESPVMAVPFSTSNEKALHAALKAWYAQPGDRFEVPVDGYVIDIVRGDLLVEIQTQNLTAITRKLTNLAKQHTVRLVYPIAQEKWIVKRDPEGPGRPSRRKSPKRGAWVHVFGELVHLPRLLLCPRFSLDVLLIQEEEARRYDGGRRWRRRGWVTEEHRLLRVVDQRLFETPADVASLLPPTLVEPFATSDLAAAIAQPRWLAQRMAYCLREMGLIVAVGRRGKAILYRRTAD